MKDDEEIEKLRRLNEAHRQLYVNPVDQKQKGVSFSSKEQVSVVYYNKSSPSIATNPYQNNLFNSANKDVSHFKNSDITIEQHN